MRLLFSDDFDIAFYFSRGNKDVAIIIIQQRLSIGKLFLLCQFTYQAISLEVIVFQSLL